MPRIFISYRRDDTAPYAGRLFADLADHVQRGDLIMDIDSIAPGEHFGQFIRDEVGSCDVLLALIGKRWLTIRDSRRRRRLDDPEDFVRIEIGTALARDIRVVPVLLGGARVPNPARLPPDLQALSQRQAVEITDERWNYDVGRLIEALDATVNPVPRPPLDAQPDTRLRLVRDTRVISAGVVTLTLAAVALVWQVLQWADPGTGVRTDG